MTDLERAIDTSAARHAAKPAIERLSADVWVLAELSLPEVESARAHTRELEAAGFEVRAGVAGVPAAFVAERSQGDGGPLWPRADGSADALAELVRSVA